MPDRDGRGDVAQREGNEPGMQRHLWVAGRQLHRQARRHAGDVVGERPCVVRELGRRRVSRLECGEVRIPESVGEAGRKRRQVDRLRERHRRRELQQLYARRQRRDPRVRRHDAGLQIVQPRRRDERRLRRRVLQTVGTYS
jgi:hypothetical protein